MELDDKLHSKELSEDKWFNIFLKMVKETVKPLIFAVLLSSNVVFWNSLSEKLDFQSDFMQYNEKNINKSNQYFVAPVWIDLVEYEQRVQEIVTLINQYRKDNWLNELELSHDLDMACQWYANYSVESWWYKWHTDREWRTFTDRLNDSNYDWFAVENIIYSPWDSQGVFDGRKGSEWHNKNMLVNHWKYISIWIAKNEYWTYVTVMIIHN